MPCEKYNACLLAFNDSLILCKIEHMLHHNFSSFSSYLNEVAEQSASPFKVRETEIHP